MSFKGNFSNEDKVVKQQKVRQLIDVLQRDIAGTNGSSVDTKTRKKYQVFSKGGSPGHVVTSSLFQTVFDQDNTLQTSNEMLDFTIGSYASEEVNGTFTVNSLTITPDASGKLVFDDANLMMREKVNIYKQYAQLLLGDSSAHFSAPFESSDANNKIEYALFINIKRLFCRDGLEKGQLSLKLYHSTSSNSADGDATELLTRVGDQNTYFSLFEDSGASSNLRVTSQAGAIGTIKGSINSAEVDAGLVFYDKGIIVLDAEKVFNTNQILTGTINKLAGADEDFGANKTILDLWEEATIDDILDHICGTRFDTGLTSAMGFVNTTSINSSIYIARIGPNECNYSSNPTYTDDDGTIRCIQDKGDDPFSYITTVGLYAGNELVAVAKLSRPIEKNPEVDLSISVRLDF
jgi:hypothetical protein